MFTNLDTESSTRMKSTTVIKPVQGWQLADLREVWEYKELLGFFIWRDIVVRYKQTVLGTAWALVQPLVTTIIWSVIFGYMLDLGGKLNDIPYPVFVLAGLLPWNIFSGGLAGSSSSVLSGGGILTKIYFPRLIFPIASVGVNLVNFVISFVMLLVLMLCYGIIPGPQILLLPVVVFLILMTTLSLGIGLAAAMVLYRDVRYLSPFALQMMLYLTPVIYPVTIIPERFRWVISLNPMTGLIDAFRWTLYGKPFSWGSLGISMAMMAIAFTLSSIIFRRADSKFADII